MSETIVVIGATGAVGSALARRCTARDAARLDALAAELPGSPAVPADATDADFLLSDAVGWITGQVIAVDGGRSTVRTCG